jgi:hypothetical protein
MVLPIDGQRHTKAQDLLALCTEDNELPPPFDRHLHKIGGYVVMRNNEAVGHMRHVLHRVKEKNRNAVEAMALVSKAGLFTHVSLSRLEGRRGDGRLGILSVRTPKRFT